MKVNSTNNSTVNATTAGGVRDAKPGKNSAADLKGAELESAKVQMSRDAQAMQKAKAIAGKQTVDEAKVARLQKLIDEGKYKVDAESVADRLVDEHLAIGE